MSKNEKVTENKEQTEQKVMTKYDRKVQKRKEEKEKEKKEERISTTVGIVFLDVYKRQNHICKSYVRTKGQSMMGCPFTF